MSVLVCVSGRAYDIFWKNIKNILYDMTNWSNHIEFGLYGIRSGLGQVIRSSQILFDLANESFGSDSVTFHSVRFKLYLV